MIHTDEDDEFNRIERESKLRMEAVYQEVQRRNKAMEKEYVRPWVGLTDVEVDQFEIWYDEEEERKGWVEPRLVAQYFEAKLKEKNT